MKLSDWFRRGLKGIQRSLQKTLLTRLSACAPIKGYIYFERTLLFVFIQGRKKNNYELRQQQSSDNNNYDNSTSTDGFTSTSTASIIVRTATDTISIMPCASIMALSSSSLAAASPAKASKAASENADSESSEEKAVATATTTTTTYATLWEARRQQLATYKEENGHTNVVPVRRKDTINKETQSLALWVGTSTSKKKMEGVLL
jgi:hypothetical protein